MDLVTRSEWGARPYRTPNGAIRYAGPRRGVKLHYLGTAYSDRPHDQCAAYIRRIQDNHMDRNGWSDIGYSFLVCTHGTVYEGRGLQRRNSANGNTALNEQDYAVCLLVGSSGLTRPTDAQLHGARDAIEHCRTEGPAGEWLGGHRDGYATSCPGDAIYTWVKAGAPRPHTPDDGTYTVLPGDTLTSIARRHGTTVEALVEANALPDRDHIEVGQRLRIPTAQAAAPARPVVDLSRLIAAARQDPAKRGTPVSYAGVRVVEDALVAEGLLDRRYADGHFGTATIRAYAAWQRRCGYTGAAADGIPGRASLTKLGKRRGFTVTP